MKDLLIKSNSKIYKVNMQKFLDKIVQLNINKFSKKKVIVINNIKNKKWPKNKKSANTNKKIHKINKVIKNKPWIMLG